MRGSRTLALYLTREMVQYGLVGFAAVSVILVSQNLLKRLDELTSIGFTLADFGVVLRCLFPTLTAYAIPVALLFGVALALRRFVTDSEILAMRACGIGTQALLLPTLVVGAIVSAISGYLLIVVEHDARRELIHLLNTVAVRGSILQPGEFSGIGDRVIYVSARDRDNRLEGIMISDPAATRPFLIFAEHGRFFLDDETSKVHIELGEGELHLEGGDLQSDRYRRLYFRSIDYSFDVASLLSGDSVPVRPKQMTLEQLRNVVARAEAGDPLAELEKRNPLLYELEIHRRFALPFAPLLFALAAVPLALLGGQRSRAWGPVLCVILAFFYYAFLTLFQFLAREQWMSPFLAFWLPNALIVGLSLYQLRRGRGVAAG